MLRSRLLPTLALCCAAPLALSAVAAALQDPTPEIPADTEVLTTASGLKYCVLEPGEPGKSPTLGAKVKVHYTGWLTDGTMFDSSIVRGSPSSFQLGKVIDGWNEGLQLMTRGARFKFTIPPELGYGSGGAGRKIPPDATLIFEIELIDFEAVPEFHAARPDEQQVSESGLKWEILAAGDGAPVGENDVLVIDYAYWDEEGSLIQWSGSAQPIKAPLAALSVVPFMKEGVAQLCAGGKGAHLRFEVPADLAYAENRRPQDFDPETRTVWEMWLTDVFKPLPVPPFERIPDGVKQTTQSGLSYQMLREGTGRRPGQSSRVVVHYAGWLTDGTLFDSSYVRAEPLTFALMGVIPGWQEGMMLVGQGGVIRLEIPAKLAYGERGSPPKIGPGQDLVFHIELLEVLN